MLQLVWAAAVTTIRASIILLYMHIFSIRSFRIICYAVQAFNLAFLISTVVATCLICKPIAYNWDYTIPGGFCGNAKAYATYTAVVNLLLDFTVVMLPMRILWGLQMATRRKVAVSGMFSMGLA